MCGLPSLGEVARIGEQPREDERAQTLYRVAHEAPIPPLPIRRIHTQAYHLNPGIETSSNVEYFLFQTNNCIKEKSVHVRALAHVLHLLVEPNYLSRIMCRRMESLKFTTLVGALRNIVQTIRRNVAALIRGVGRWTPTRKHFIR